MTNSRNKGASFERQVALELNLMTGVRFQRDLEQTRAADHGDLTADDPAWPFLIECKRYASGHGCKLEWQAQAGKAAAAQGKLPAVVFKFDRLPIRVSVPFIVFGHDRAAWAEINLDDLAYLAREIMADRAIKDIGGVAA